MVLRVQSLRLLEACVNLEQKVAKLIEDRRRYSWPWQWCGSSSRQGHDEQPVKPSAIQIVTPASQPEPSSESLKGHLARHSTPQPPSSLINGQLRDQKRDAQGAPGDQHGSHAGMQHRTAAMHGLNSGGAQGMQQSVLHQNHSKASADDDILWGDNSRSKQLPKVLNADAGPDDHRQSALSGELIWQQLSRPSTNPLADSQRLVLHVAFLWVLLMMMVNRAKHWCKACCCGQDCG